MADGEGTRHPQGEVSEPSLSIPTPWSWIEGGVTATSLDHMRSIRDALDTWFELWQSDVLTTSRVADAESRNVGMNQSAPSPLISAMFSHLEGSLDRNSRPAETDWIQSELIPAVVSAASDLGIKTQWESRCLSLLAEAVWIMIELDSLRNAAASRRLGLACSACSSEERKALVWRRCVRIRQLLADGARLRDRFEGKAARAFKQWWYASLEWTRLAEKSGDAMWHQAPVLGPSSRFQVRWQTTFSKKVFR